MDTSDELSNSSLNLQIDDETYMATIWVDSSEQGMLADTPILYYQPNRCLEAREVTFALNAEVCKGFKVRLVRHRFW
jgi:hypothetical protein